MNEDQNTSLVLDSCYTVSSVRVNDYSGSSVEKQDIDVHSICWVEPVHSSCRALLRLTQPPICGEEKDDFSDVQTSLYKQFVKPLEIVLKKQDIIIQLTS